MPKVDIIDRENEIILRAELPGVSKDNLDVSLSDNTVLIRASTRHEAQEERAGYYRREMSDVTVLALPRGGVPVAYEVARYLGAPLDIFVVRKLGVPGHEELAMGALASGDVQVMNEEVVSALGISQSAIAAAVSEESRELARRERAYRGKRPPFDVSGRTVILVDDGLATGSTMQAAVAGLRQRGPDRIVVGVPIAAPSTCEELAFEVDDIVCAVTPEPFYAVALWYADFPQTTDKEVRELLEAAAREREREYAPAPVQGL